VLDNRFDRQVFKVQALYPDDENLSKSIKQISNAKVKLADMAGNVYQFEDLLMESDDYSYFTSLNFIPGRGGKYLLSVKGDNIPEAVSEVYMPSKQDITLYYDTDKIVLKYSKNSTVKGFLHHYYVDFYLKEGNNILRSYRVEVPSKIDITNNDKDTLKSYPSLTKLTDHEYSYSSLFTVLDAYRPNDSKIKLVVKKSVAMVLSLDPNLYNYVSTIKGFSDPYSVRLDQINFSNISNGYGIFGGIALDSVTEKIPPFIIQGFGFESE